MSYQTGYSQGIAELKNDYKPTTDCAENIKITESLETIVSEYKKGMDGSERSKGYLDAYEERLRQSRLYFKFGQCDTYDQDVQNEYAKKKINEANEDADDDLGGKAESDSKTIFLIGGSVLILATLIIIFKAK